MKWRVKPTGKVPKARVPGGAGRDFLSPAKPPGGKTQASGIRRDRQAKRRAGPAPP